jgi:hypothetical protein
MTFTLMFKKNLGLNCPNSSSELRITHRYDAEVDYYPTSKDVWLDRGEIDKIANTQPIHREDLKKSITTNIIVGEIVMMSAITITIMMMIITIVAMVQGEGEEDF